ncbi:MAG: histidine phosphatase family protein, partial [Burkholderiaceae bacterium]
TELILIRHGETDWNRELRFQGQIDVPLNDIGFEQARRVAERLAGESVQHLVSSDLLRTRQTSQAPSIRLGLAPVHDAALREQAFGVVDGMRVGDIQQQFPQEWARWSEFDADYAFAGAESTRHFHARVMAALERLVLSHAGQRLVVVTHGGVLDMVYRSAMGLPLSGPRQSVIPNGGISRVRMQGGEVEILSWAETAHLQGMPAQPVYDQNKLASIASDQAEETSSPSEA